MVGGDGHADNLRAREAGTEAARLLPAPAALGEGRSQQPQRPCPEAPASVSLGRGP